MQSNRKANILIRNETTETTSFDLLYSDQWPKCLWVDLSYADNIIFKISFMLVVYLQICLCTVLKRYVNSVIGYRKVECLSYTMRWFSKFFSVVIER